MILSQDYEPDPHQSALIGAWQDDCAQDHAEDAGCYVARIITVDDDSGLRELPTEFLVDDGLGAEAVASGAASRAVEPAIVRSDHP